MGIKKKDNSDDLVINDMEDWKNLRNVPGMDLFFLLLYSWSFPGLIVVDVYTRWAGPCDVMKPIINKVKTTVSRD